MDVSNVTAEAIAKLEHDAVLADPFWDQFAVLGKQVIEEVLIAKNWNQEEAWEELVLRATSQDNEQEKRKRDERNQQALLEMQEVFKSIPKEKIEQTIEKHDGDMEAVTNELILLNVDYTVQLLANKFGATVEHTKELFLANDKNDRKVTAILLKEQALVKVRAHQKDYPMFTEEDLLRAYFSKNSNEQLWLTYLNTEKQRIIEEEKDRAKKLQEEAQKEAQRKAEEEALAQQANAEKARLEQLNQEKLNLLANEQREEQLRKNEQELKKRQEEQALRNKERAEALQKQLLQQQADHARQQELKRIEAELKQKEADLKFNESVAVGHQQIQDKKQQAAQFIEKMVRDGHGALPPQHFGDTMPLQPKKEEPKNLPPQGKLWPVKLTLDKTRVESGATVTVTWEHSAEPTKADWVALYKVDATNKYYISSMWEKIEGSADKRFGSISFTVPANFGMCEFRYICPSARDAYQVFGVSNPFRIGPSFVLQKEVISDTEIKVTVKKEAGEAHPYGWIALFPSTSTSYLKPWHYLTQDTTIHFTIPKKSGLYFVKAFAAKAADSLAGVLEHRVAGTDVLQFRPTDNSVNISYDLSSVDVATDNVWVGLYPITETSNDKWKQFTWLRSNKGECTMKRPRNPSGQYELRLFAFGSMVTLTKSNTASF